MPQRTPVGQCTTVCFCFAYVPVCSINFSVLPSYFSMKCDMLLDLNNRQWLNKSFLMSVLLKGSIKNVI